jgi:maternal effect protein oskar
LVGDNFFLNVAVTQLGFRVVKRNHVLQSGFCASGQTIAEATKNLTKMDSNELILLNIGSTDIVQGRELIELIIDMIKLWNICLNRNIKPILTTIPPLANYRLGNRRSVTDGFNDFLLNNPHSFPVIELHQTFYKKDGTVDYKCFQNVPRYASGLKKPIVFWSRLGRNRVIQNLTKELGMAILRLTSV